MGNQHGGHHEPGSDRPQLKKSTSKNKIVLHENIPLLCQMLIDKSKKHEVGENISRRAFVKYFSTGQDKFGETLYEHYVRQQPSLDVHYITKETFVKVSEEALELKTDVNQLKHCIKVFAHGRDALSKDDVLHLFETCYILASTVSNCTDMYDLSSDGAKSYIEALSTGAMKGSDSVTVDALCNWINKNCHNLIFGVHHWVSQKLLNVRPVELEPDNFERELQTPGLMSISKDSKALLNPVLLWLLTCSIPVVFTKPKKKRVNMQRMLSREHMDPHAFIAHLLSSSTTPRWTPLYDCHDHGMSLNRFQNQVFSYRGASVMLLAVEEGRTFCVAVDEEWKEQTHKWGGEHCTVVQITPEFKIMETGPKMMYMNVNTRGHPHGIHVGHSSKTPCLEIDEEMAIVLVKKIPYRLLNLEVWGCAGEETHEAQIQQKRWNKSEAERCHQVNLNAVDWKDNADKYLLELGSNKVDYSS